ncbi:MAG: MFS transporter [Clostridium sp.]|uniref:MFS transporter n=1 Tax=Clostridium sp. TaxID=1506 RepID=UPI003D6C9985
MGNINILKKLKIKFSLLQITYWCNVGAFSAFIVSYMQSKGMTATLIGVMLMISTCGAFGGQLFWGRMSDKLKSNKKIFIIANILILIMHVVVFYMPNWTLIIITFGILGFIEIPVAANLDTWILKIYHKTPQAYGPIRASASIGFAVFTLFYGGILEKYGYFFMIVFSSSFVIMSICIAIFIPDAEISDIMNLDKSADKNTFKKLILNKSFIFILFIILCTGISTSPMMQMMPLLMSNVGGTVKYVGFTMFASGLAQVPFMIFSNKLSFISAKKRMLLAGLMYFLSLILTSIAKTPDFIVFCSILNGVGFGLMLPAMREYIFQSSPKEFHTTAQSISDATYLSLAGIISNSLAGLMVDSVGIRALLVTCSLIQMIGIVLLVINIYGNKRTNG